MTTSIERPAPRMADETGVRFGLASGALVVALLVASPLPLNLDERASFSLFVAAVAGVSLNPLCAVWLGLEAWAYFTGFFENGYGVLTLSAHDLLNLAGFVVMTVALSQLIRVSVAIARHGEHR